MTVEGLAVRNLQVRLGANLVLRHVDLRAPPGQVLALVGPNGAGKSTLLRAAAGLVRSEGGSVQIDGVTLHEVPARQRSALVGLVPQQDRMRWPFTVTEVVRMGRYGRRADPGSDAEAVRAALHEARLGHLVDRPVTELSGGERQRVLLARTLAQDPRVVLLDEPTANLDLGQAHWVERRLRRWAEEGRVVVVVVHDLAAAARFADRIALLSEGRVVAEGSARDVLRPATIEAAYGAEVAVSWHEDELRVRVERVPDLDPSSDRR